MRTDLITKVYFNEHLTHSCVGMPQGLQALLSSYIPVLSLYYHLNRIHIMCGKQILGQNPPTKEIVNMPNHTQIPLIHRP